MMRSLARLLICALAHLILIPLAASLLDSGETVRESGDPVYLAPPGTP